MTLQMQSAPGLDPRDKAIHQATPTVAAPLFSALEPVNVDAYRYVHAGNGVFLEARTPALYALVKLTESLGAPYGVLESKVCMVDGLVEADIGEQIFEKAIAACPLEWAGVVVYDREQARYRLFEPEVNSNSNEHINYNRIKEDDRYTIVVDVHTHGNGQPVFSSIDDESDIDGIYIAVVVGRCGRRETIHASSRLVVYGRHIALDWLPWRQS